MLGPGQRFGHEHVHEHMTKHELGHGHKYKHLHEHTHTFNHTHELGACCIQQGVQFAAMFAKSVYKYDFGKTMRLQDA
jgi:hypothetical protein